MADHDPSAATLIDVQARTPPLALSLSRVGVTGVEKVIHLTHDDSELAAAA
jgi:GTP cyclohydrolase FolE2